MRYIAKHKKACLCAVVAISTWLSFIGGNPLGANVRSKITITSLSQREWRLPKSLSLPVPATSKRQQSTKSQPGDFTPPDSRKIIEAYQRLPLVFEPNRGQTSQEVKFLSREAGYTLFLAENEAVIVFGERNRRAAGSTFKGIRPTKKLSHAEPVHEMKKLALRMKLVGSKRADVFGIEELPGASNYFSGNNPANWHKDIPHYAKVKYKNVYPGIDMVYYGSEGRLEYDFVLGPGADPTSIRIAFKGADNLEVDKTGNLSVHTVLGELYLKKPAIYQDIDGERKQISGGYLLAEEENSNSELAAEPSEPDTKTVKFQLAQYDITKPLIIDPVLVYSTYLGGGGDVSHFSSDDAYAIAADSSGNAYVTGATESISFPTTAGAFYIPCESIGDNCVQTVFVSKINPSGTALVYSAYFGSGIPAGIAVDSAGNAYITGVTSSGHFPVTAGAFQTSLAGFSDAFVSNLSASGSTLLYSTYIGGSSSDIAMAIAVDSTGCAYITGNTSSMDYPTTPGAFHIATHPGSIAFVTKLNPDGASLKYSTYLGERTITGASGIAVDVHGNAYVTGYTEDFDFPITEGAFQRFCTPSPFVPTYCNDAFLTKLNPEGTAVLYSTYFGGTDDDYGNAVAVDSTGYAYIAGGTWSVDLPVTQGAFQLSSGGFIDGFVAKFDTLASGSASLLYSTYLGGSLDDFAVGIAVDSAENVYVAGQTISYDFPVKEPLQFLHAPQSPEPHNLSAFVTKLDSTGSQIIFSTYLGGSGWELPYGLAIDGDGNAYVTGRTLSLDYPTTDGALQPSCAETNHTSCADAFVAKISSSVATSPRILVTPVLQDFGDEFGAAIDNRSFTVWNMGAGTLTGVVTTSAPFAINNGSQSYSIGPGDSQIISVRRDGTSLGTFVRNVNFTGGGGATAIVKVNIVGASGNPILNIIKAGAGGGSITGLDINCNDSCAISLPPGWNITLTATPVAGSRFYGWAGDCTGTGPCALTMNGSKTVYATFTTPLSIGSTVLPAAEANMPYNFVLTPAGGSPPYTLKVTKGSLPPGLSLGSPVILGTPTRAGTYNFTIQVSDQLGGSVSQKFQIKVVNAVGISTKSLQAGKVNKGYNVRLAATGGQAPYRWSLLSGTLPGGLTFNPSSGSISGTPTTASGAALTFQVSDMLGGTSQRALTLTVK